MASAVVATVSSLPNAKFLTTVNALMAQRGYRTLGQAGGLYALYHTGRPKRIDLTIEQ